VRESERKRGPSFDVVVAWGAPGPGGSAGAGGGSAGGGGGSAGAGGPSSVPPATASGTVYCLYFVQAGVLHVYIGSTTQPLLQDRGQGSAGEGWSTIREAYSGTVHVTALFNLRASSRPGADVPALGKHGTTYVNLLIETLAIQAALRTLSPSQGVHVLNKRVVGTTSFSGFTFSPDECRRGGTCREVWVLVWLWGAVVCGTLPGVVGGVDWCGAV